MPKHWPLGRLLRRIGRRAGRRRRAGACGSWNITGLVRCAVGTWRRSHGRRRRRAVWRGARGGAAGSAAVAGHAAARRGYTVVGVGTPHSGGIAWTRAGLRNLLLIQLICLRGFRGARFAAHLLVVLFMLGGGGSRCLGGVGRGCTAIGAWCGRLRHRLWCHRTKGQCRDTDQKRVP